METDTVRCALAAALQGRRLLEHPFYRRWEAGDLDPGELAGYAEQYRHVERAVPALLGGIVAGLPDGTAKDLVTVALADEQGVPEAHVVLFESFAAAAGARPDAPAGPAAVRLTELQLGAADRDPLAALAMVAAYETQAGDIATSKAQGLRDHFGFDEMGTRFWDVHAVMELDHAKWSLQALALLSNDPAEISVAAGLAAAAWWEFLDEREAMAHAA
jgi:pyrroloquinoline-quinone synthase